MEWENELGFERERNESTISRALRDGDKLFNLLISGNYSKMKSRTAVAINSELLGVQGQPLMDGSNKLLWDWRSLHWTSQRGGSSGSKSTTGHAFVECLARRWAPTLIRFQNRCHALEGLWCTFLCETGGRRTSSIFSFGRGPDGRWAQTSC